MCASKQGISSNQLHRVRGVTSRTAWHMSHRSRLAMAPGSSSGPLGGEGKTVEADESFMNKQRGRDTWTFSNETGWLRHRDRYSIPFFALVERGGRARAMPINSTTSHDLRVVLKKHASTKSQLMTDEWRGYRLA